MTLPFFRPLLGLLLVLASALAVAEDPLPPEQAFRFSARMLDAQTLIVRYDIARGYYLYRDKFQFTGERGPTLGEARYPAGKVKDDEFFGKVETYRDRVEIRVPVAAGGPAETVLAFKATSQGCADMGLCYPPKEDRAEVKLVAGSTPPGAAPVAPGATPFLAPLGPSPAAAVPGESEDGQIARLLAGGSFWVVVATFFGFGLALAFTPCMLPMIPILSGIVVGQGQGVTRGRAFALSMAYVLGMAVTYAAAGVAAGLSGAMLSAALQNAWVLGAFAAVFVALALSMFGLYELQLPSGVQSWLAERSNHMRGGHLAGVFVMGVVSALIVGPCVAPPLAGALLFIAERGEVALGGSALFAMALGMGTPLVGVGVSAGHLTVKTGPWMQSVRNFFGVMLLGLAIWIVSPVVSAVVHMVAWGILLTVSAIYLHALDPLPAGASGYRKLWKGVGVVALLTGAALLIGALAGGRDVLQPLSGIRLVEAGVRTGGAAAEHVRFERVANLDELQAKLQAAGGRPVILDFYADWCVSCKEMERFTFTDARVRKRMDEFVLLQADVTANGPNDAALLKRFSLFGPPGIIFFDRNGQEVRGLRVIGFQPAERFASTLDLALR